MKRCPYFAPLAARAAAEPSFSYRIFASGRLAARWRLANDWNRFSPRATLLADDDPLGVRWPPGSAIVDATNQPGEIVHALAQALIRDNCTHALFVDLADSTRSFHCKRSPQAVAA